MSYRVTKNGKLVQARSYVSVADVMAEVHGRMAEEGLIVDGRDASVSHAALEKGTWDVGHGYSVRSSFPGETDERVAIMDGFNWYRTQGTMSKEAAALLTIAECLGPRS